MMDDKNNVNVQKINETESVHKQSGSENELSDDSDNFKEIMNIYQRDLK